MASNVVEINIRGIDEASKIFAQIEKVASKSFSQIESEIESIPDVDIDTNIDTSRAEKELSDVEGAVDEVESAIKSIPDPKINSGDARGDMAKVEGAVDEVEGAIKSLPDPEVDTSDAINGMKKLQDEAEETADAIEGIDLGAIIGGVGAGIGIKEVIERSLATADLNTKIELSFDVPKESIKSVKQATKSVEAYGLDASEALEGVRRQFAMNSDASDEANQKIIKGAGMIASAYDGIDFIELIQETNELSTAMGTTDDEALGLVNSLLKLGFPPEQLDIITEYGSQLARAGFTAEEIQGIFSAGVDTESWNIDNLMDGLKEGRVLLSELGEGIDDATYMLIQGTSISEEQLIKWGKAVASGGKDGKKAMVEVAKALDGVEDATTKNALGVKLFGTMWEDQGDAIIQSLLGAEEGTYNLAEGVEDLGEGIENLDSSPAVAMQNAMNALNSALEPVLSKVAGVIGRIAEWMQANPQLVATISAVMVAVGIIGGALMALAPIIFSVTQLAGAFNAILLANPIGIVIGAIVALGAGLIHLWKTSDEFKAGVTELWTTLKETVVQTVTELWEGIKNIWNTYGEQIIGYVTEVASKVVEMIVEFLGILKDTWNEYGQGIVDLISGFVTLMVDIFMGLWETVYGIWEEYGQSIYEGVVGFVENTIDLIMQLWEKVEPIIQTALEFIKKIWNEHLKGMVKKLGEMIAKLIDGALKIYNEFIKPLVSWVIDYLAPKIEFAFNLVIGVAEGLFKSIKDVFNGIMDILGGVIDFVVGVFTGDWEKAWNGIKDIFAGIWSTFVGIVKAPLNAVIGLINGAIKSLNKISVDIPDWVPKFGGSTFGVNIPEIPYLAKGGLAIDETLAVIGEGADDEAVLPLNSGVLGRLGGLIAKHMDGGTGSNINLREFAREIATAIADKLGPLLTEQQIRLVLEDAGNGTGGYDIEQISRDLFRLYNRDRAKRGMNNF